MLRTREGARLQDSCLWEDKWTERSPRSQSCTTLCAGPGKARGIPQLCAWDVAGTTAGMRRCPWPRGSYRLWRLPWPKCVNSEPGRCSKSQSVTLFLPTSKATTRVTAEDAQTPSPFPHRRVARGARSRACLPSVPAKSRCPWRVFVISHALGKTHLIADCFSRDSPLQTWVHWAQAKPQTQEGTAALRLAPLPRPAAGSGFWWFTGLSPVSPLKPASKLPRLNMSDHPVGHRGPTSPLQAGSLSLVPASIQTWAECWACRREQGKGCPQVAQRLQNYQLAEGAKEHGGEPACQAPLLEVGCLPSGFWWLATSVYLVVS